MAGQPKPAFYMVVGVVVVALLAFGIWRFRSTLAPTPTQTDAPPITLPDGGVVALQKDKPEDPKGGDITLTVKEYDFIPAQTLPPVTGASSYTPLKNTNNTVRFAINVWAGWGPIILANDGFKPGKVWKSPKGNEFKVELVKIDDIVAMRDAYASGQIHIGWATLDMVPLLLQTFVDKEGHPRDSRIMPRIYQQIDWSNGGDGIVVRDNIKTVADLRGKQIVLAQNSPSQYFLLRMLVSSGIQPHEVKSVYTKGAFEAAAAFNGRKELSGCVSWAPDIYNLIKEKSGNRILVTTGTANKLIADVWFARADFAKDYPDIIEGLVRGIFDAMIEMENDAEKKSDAVKKKVAQLMAAGYEMKPEETEGMLGDAHITNWAENAQFFLNQNNPTNFERIWNTAYSLYSHPQVGAIKHKPVPFDQVMDYTYIQVLGKEEKYSKQEDRSRIIFSPLPADAPVEGPEILGNKYYIRFAPNSSDLREKIIRTKDGKKVEEPADPNVDAVLDQIAQLAGQFGAARIVIEGHTDSSMKAQIPPHDVPLLAAEVKKLSEKRAESVRQALVEKYKLNVNQLTPRGLGWSRPADPTNPNNQNLNRRVEVRVYSAESQ